MPNDFKLGFEIKKMMKVKTFSFGNPDVFSLEFLMIPVKKKVQFFHLAHWNQHLILTLHSTVVVVDDNHQGLEVVLKRFGVQNGHFGSKFLKFHYIISPIFGLFRDADG